MKLLSPSFSNGSFIPAEFAFGKPSAKTHVELSTNRNPALEWSEVPAGTRSLVLVCHDPDVPSEPTDVNQEGRRVPASLPRVDFYHWVLVDLSPQRQTIAAGEFSKAITPRGKSGPEGPDGTRQGVNNYTQWFENDPQMAGTYFGYDGPCPPWNDEIVHHYHFTLYALSVPRCPVEGSFTAPEVLKAIQGKVLAEARITGLYAIASDARLLEKK